MTAFNLLRWKWTGSNSKSDIEFDKLTNLLKSTDFSRDDLASFNRDSETKRVDNYIDGTNEAVESTPNTPSPRSRWREVPVFIPIPHGNVPASEAPLFEIPGLHYRPITEVVYLAVHHIFT